MIKLKNKPKDCTGCPFCYESERYVRENGRINFCSTRRCGALMADADYKNCPILD